MITVSVYYPRRGGQRFDQNYYLQSHMKLVREKLGPHGLQSVSVDIGIAGLNNTPAPFYAVGHMHFPNREGWQQGFAACGQELVADVANYTDVQPLLMISEHVEA